MLSVATCCTAVMKSLPCLACDTIAKPLLISLRVYMPSLAYLATLPDGLNLPVSLDVVFIINKAFAPMFPISPKFCFFKCMFHFSGWIFGHLSLSLLFIETKGNGFIFKGKGV